MQFCIQLYIVISRIIPYLQANPYGLITKNINSLIFISTITKWLMLMIFFVFREDFFKKQKKTAGCILIFFSTELLFKMKL